MIALVTVAGGILTYFVHVRPKQAVARYKAELLAHAEKLTLSEMLPLPPPRALDGTERLRRAMSQVRNRINLLDTNGPKSMEMVAPARSLVGWQQADLVDFQGKSPVTNHWEEVAATLADEREVLDSLAMLVEQPMLDWRLNYHEGFAMLLPHLAPMKQMAQRAQSAMLLEWHRNNPTNAVKHLRVMLALLKGSHDERLIISQLVRMAVANIAFAATWAAVQSPAVTDEQLVTVQQDWAALDFSLPMENALAMERAMSLMTLDRMRNSSAEFQKVSTGFGGGGGGGGVASEDWMEKIGVAVGEGWNATKNKAKESAWRVSWSLTDELTALKGQQVMLEAIRAARSNGCYLPAIQRQREQFAELGITNRSLDDLSGLLSNQPDLQRLFTDSLLSLGKTLDKIMANETTREMAVVGIALRRYQVRHGHYPAELSALTPEFLPTMPRDPVDGKPLHYHPVGERSFLLYSIGKDGVDDGGDAANPQKNGSLFWQNGRDWVWPQPASVEEIAVYFEKQAQRAAR